MLAESYVKMVVLKLNNPLLRRREGMEFQNIYLSHNDREIKMCHSSCHHHKYPTYLHL